MRTLLCWLLILTPLMAQRPAPKAGWYTDYASAKAEAVRTKKPLLVVVRCEPCTDFAKLDGQVNRMAKPLDTLADSFVRLRLTRLSGMDLTLFDFDFDLSWAVLFLSAEETVYGRYGGRDATSIDGQLSVTGLAHAMQKVLTLHQAIAGMKPDRSKPMKIEDYPAAKLRKRNDCLHCHLVNEFRYDAAIQAKTWKPEQRWVYPTPATLGLTLEVERGDTVKTVQDLSPAAQAGLRGGDILDRIHGRPISSFADVQYALHHAPTTGTIEVTYRREGQTQTAKVTLTEGWRKTDTTWRPSLLRLLPSPEFSGMDLTVDAKKALMLPATQAVFQQDKFVHSTLKAIGLQKDDIIVGLNGKPIAGTMEDYIAHLRREYLVGDSVTINIMRAGKAMALPLVLK